MRVVDSLMDRAISVEKRLKVGETRLKRLFELIFDSLLGSGLDGSVTASATIPNR